MTTDQRSTASPGARMQAAPVAPAVLGPPQARVQRPKVEQRDVRERNKP